MFINMYNTKEGINFRRTPRARVGVWNINI